jgi:hypothetical protein
MNIASFLEIQNLGYVGKLLNKPFLNIDLMRQISNFLNWSFSAAAISD